MSYHKFKDSKGREFEGNVYCEYAKGVDSIFSIEDASYLDGEKEEVPADELDFVYNDPDQELDRIGHEDVMGG